MINDVTTDWYFYYLEEIGSGSDGSERGLYCEILTKTTTDQMKRNDIDKLVRR